MHVKVLGSTKPGFVLSVEEATIFSGHSAGICYMPDDIEALWNEPVEKTQKRAESTIDNGHHSVVDHPVYNLYLQNIPKILAMILNNEQMYTTSEKSARYTQMQPSESEKLLYDKWLEIFQNKILSINSDVAADKAKKLAQENARYLISVFTPTNMEYTVSLRQLDYICIWFDEFINNPTEIVFFNKLKPVMAKFVEQVNQFRVPELTDNKSRKISIFDTRASRKDEFGENYCYTYRGSFAQLAQAQRHRTLDYKLNLLPKPAFYVPEMIFDDVKLSKMWLEDMNSVADIFPQGMLVSICERGTYENFILKAKERLCSAAQLEITKQTFETLGEYMKNTKENNPEIYDELSKYESGARCGADFKCKTPCSYGIKQQQRKF